MALRLLTRVPMRPNAKREHALACEVAIVSANPETVDGLLRWENVTVAIAELRTRRPRALRVLVTSHPRRFHDLATPESDVIVPPPAWGWKILDVVRAHVEGTTTR